MLKYSLFESIGQKKHTSAGTRPKGSMGKSIELLHMLNTNIKDIINANFPFFSCRTSVKKVCLATLNFRRIFLTQRPSTVKVKLQI